jgi:ketosteroid isomerase-like protein
MVRTAFLHRRPLREMLPGAMAQENEQLLRRGYDRLNASDSEGFLRVCATDFEMHDLPSLPGAGVHIGHDAARAWWARMCEVFGELRFDPDEILDAGDGRFVVVCHVYGRGTHSGASIDGLTFNIWTVRDGKLSSCATYDTHAEALAAAGLDEHLARGPGLRASELREQST